MGSRTRQLAAGVMAALLTVAAVAAAVAVMMAPKMLYDGHRAMLYDGHSRAPVASGRMYYAVKSHGEGWTAREGRIWI
jgi:hypothetical protein